jgi:hypothetical protein
MMIRISQLRQRLDDWQLPLEEVAARALRVKPGEVRWARLLRKSVDARDKGDVHFTLTLDVETIRPIRPQNGVWEYDDRAINYYAPGQACQSVLQRFCREDSAIAAHMKTVR